VTFTTPFDFISDYM